MKKRMCNLLGHKWRYNFPSMPNKAICKRCKEKVELNLRNLQWTDTFEDSRSDEELISKWV